MWRDTITVTVCLVLASIAPVRGAYHIVVGPGTLDGPVPRPQTYLDVVAPLATDRFGFDNDMPGQNFAEMDLGPVTMSTPSAGGSIVVQADRVAGARVATGPNGLLITSVGADPRRVDFRMGVPVQSLGFTLLGGETAVQVRLYGSDGSLTAAVVPHGIVGDRRWVGLFGDAAVITRIEVEALSDDDFGLDDVEVGHHAPEPTSLLLCGCGTIVLLRRRHR